VTTALYRRYRPETFGEMIAQAQVTEPLMTALRSDRIGHAYLFSGPRGCGKTTSARILARCLNCAEGPTDTPCGVCDSCVELSRSGGGSLDVVEIDAASHNGVDDARDLRERAIFAPARDRYKIFILDEAHMVTPQGFNALLKLVEEPPAHVKFIFATTEPDKVIGTIRSRTHHYPFRLVPPAAMLEYVEKLCTEEGVAVDQGVLPLVVRAGGGSPRDTLSILDQLIAGSEAGSVAYERAVALLGYTHGELLDEVIDAFSIADAAGAFGAVDRVVQTGQDPRRFVDDLLERLRDLIVIAATGAGASAVLRGIPADELQRMALQAERFGADRLSLTADIVSAALDGMSGATSPRLQLELMIARVLAHATGRAASAESGRRETGQRAAAPAGQDAGAGLAATSADTGRPAAPPATPTAASVASPTTAAPAVPPAAAPGRPAADPAAAPGARAAADPGARPADPGAPAAPGASPAADPSAPAAVPGARPAAEPGAPASAPSAPGGEDGRTAEPGASTDRAHSGSAPGAGAGTAQSWAVTAPGSGAAPASQAAPPAGEQGAHETTAADAPGSTADPGAAPEQAVAPSEPSGPERPAAGGPAAESAPGPARSGRPAGPTADGAGARPGEAAAPARGDDGTIPAAGWATIPPGGHGPASYRAEDAPRDEDAPPAEPEPPYEPEHGPAAPQQPAQQSLSLAAVHAAWHDILAHLEGQRRSSWLVLQSARVVAVRGDVVTLVFTNQSDLATFKQRTPAGGGVSEDLRVAIAEKLGVRVKYLAHFDGGDGAAPPSGGGSMPPSGGPAGGGTAASSGGPVGGGSASPSAGPAGGGSARPPAGGPSEDGRASESAVPQSGGAGGGAPAAGADAPTRTAPSAAPALGAPSSAAPSSAPPARPVPTASSAAPVTDWAVATIPGAVAPPVRALPVDDDPEEAEVPAAVRTPAPIRDGEIAAPGYRQPVEEDDDADPGDVPPEPAEAIAPGPAPSAPTVQARRIAPEGVQRYGEAVVRQMLGATFLHEEPYEPATRFQ
jgi:DNA polymerase-3 subunit gamma/tau